jgi:hypothetical protein
VAHDGVMRGVYMRIYGTRSRGTRRFGALGSHLSERIAERGHILADTFMIHFRQMPLNYLSSDHAHLSIVTSKSARSILAVTFMSHAFAMVDIQTMI